VRSTPLPDLQAGMSHVAKINASLCRFARRGEPITFSVEDALAEHARWKRGARRSMANPDEQHVEPLRKTSMSQ
jgi:hypothetical protein